MTDPDNIKKKMAAQEANGNVKHGINKFRKLDWKDEDQLTNFMFEHLKDDELDRLKMYLRTLAEDETLNLTSFEIKRIAIAMLALDRGDNWFFKKTDDNKEWYELSVELQKFLAGKEAMIIETLRKAKTQERKAKSLWDQLEDPTIKNIEIKAEGTVEGIDYVFEAKKKTSKPKMLLPVIVKEGEKDGDDNKQSKTEDKEEDED